MIIIPITPSAGRGMVRLLECYLYTFGRWAFAAWLISGAVAFGGLMLFSYFYTPELVHWPHDGGDWFGLGLLLAICLAGGPAAIPVGPFMALIFQVCIWSGI